MKARHSRLLFGLATVATLHTGAALSAPAVAGPAAPVAARTAVQALSVTRGPYLQLGTPTSVVVRWRTNDPSDSVVWYGTDPANLTASASSPASAENHSVTLTGLTPDTRYYYAVGSSAGRLAGDSSHFFLTAPPVGTPKPTRLWVLGDAGTSSPFAANVRDAYYGYTGTRHTDLWLMLGDNAYPDGTDFEYQTAVFNMYPEMLRKSVSWSTLGNHDGNSADSGTQTGPYYDIFTLPAKGEAGGVPSGTEAYYSFDYGDIHFVCLDSTDSDRSVNGAMLTWLRQDLADTNQPWLVAFWHHPPYSHGSHDSDEESALIAMRENALPILEDYGVDLVLSGHSHSYERSWLMDGHYGTSDTLTPSMILDPGNGNPESDGAYRKSSAGMAGHEGAVYVVAGNSGQISDGRLDHPAMYLSLRILGSLVIDVEGEQLDVRLLDTTGEWRDWFRIQKGVGPIPMAPFDLAAAPVSSTQIELTWSEDAQDEVGFKIERSPDLQTWSEVGTVGANVTSFVDGDLEPASLYYYRVRTATSGSDSPYSNTATATTQEESGCSSLTLMKRRGGAPAGAPVQGAGFGLAALGLVWLVRRRR